MQIFRLTGDGDVTLPGDGAWQKKGSGRSYDSQSGHASLMGEKCGKVVAVEVASLACKFCEAHKGEPFIPDHKCSKNYTGSSKGMESKLIIDMLQNIKEKGVEVNQLVLDGDSTTVARARKTVNPSLKVRRDKNHVKKGFATSMYDLKKKSKHCTDTIVKSMRKNFNYAISQNQGNAEGLKKALEACVEHPFGNHTNCGKWCNGRNNPDYKHPNLARGKDLTSPQLKAELRAIIQPYINGADVYSNMGSTQGNENFNQMATTKARKQRNYCKSSSLKYRIKQTALQKNEGQKYMLKVSYEELFDSMCNYHSYTKVIFKNLHI